MIFRILQGDGTIVKVLFAMSKVLMSLTGEVVCEELMNTISKIRTFPGNAKSNIDQCLPTAPQQNNVEQVQAK